MATKPVFDLPDFDMSPMAAKTVEVLPPPKQESLAAAKRLAKLEQARLSAKFVADVNAIWQEQGPSILRRAAFSDPLGFARLAASLVPKQIDVTTAKVEEIENDRLDKLIGTVEGLLDGGLGTVTRTLAGREAEADGGTKALVVQPLPETTRVPREGE